MNSPVSTGTSPWLRDPPTGLDTRSTRRAQLQAHGAAAMGPSPIPTSLEAPRPTARQGAGGEERGGAGSGERAAWPAGWRVDLAPDMLGEEELRVTVYLGNRGREAGAHAGWQRPEHRLHGQRRGRRLRRLRPRRGRGPCGPQISPPVRLGRALCPPPLRPLRGCHGDWTTVLPALALAPPPSCQACPTSSAESPLTCPQAPGAVLERGTQGHKVPPGAGKPSEQKGTGEAPPRPGPGHATAGNSPGNSPRTGSPDR